MTNDIKQALRILTTDFDAEINDLIEAAKLDLKLSGITEDKIINDDPLIKRAIIIYCKANFGWGNDEAERLNKSYEMLKNHLSLTSEYRGDV